jgi:hypothetical protein
MKMDLETQPSTDYTGVKNHLRNLWMVMANLERELPRELKNAWIEGGVNLAEVRAIYVERIRHLEVRVIENIERFEP